MSLAGVSVSIDGFAAPVLYAQSAQVNVIVPFEIDTDGVASITIAYNGNESTMDIPAAPAAPEIVKLAPSPRFTQAAALNQDGSVNSPSNPAQPGSVITIFITGTGVMYPAWPDGAIVTDTLVQSIQPVTVSFLPGTEVLYAGPAPGLVAGVIQINLQVPSSLYCGPEGFCPNPSSLPLTVTVNGTYQSVVAAAVAIAY